MLWDDLIGPGQTLSNSEEQGFQSGDDRIPKREAEHRMGREQSYSIVCSHGCCPRDGSDHPSPATDLLNLLILSQQRQLSD